MQSKDTNTSSPRRRSSGEHPNSFNIINGRVIDPANNRDGIFDIIIEDGKILHPTSSPDSCLRRNDVFIDATNLIVAPGFIDLHVHLREPGQTHKEDIESGSRAAIAGGFTTIFCMPNTIPACDNIKTLEFIKKKASGQPVKIYPVAAMTKGISGGELVDFKAMKRAGVLAISDDGNCIQDRAIMKRAMEEARDLDLLVISHPEDKGAKNSRDAENLMIKRDIELAEETGARLHIAHVSTAEGIEMVRDAKERGLKVTCEATPHHLLLTRSSSHLAGEYKSGGESLNPNFIMNPPLRDEADCRALIKGLQDGTVDAIATDHAPHAGSEKFACHPEPFACHPERSEGSSSTSAGIPPGVIGMETAFPACMKLVEDGHISLERLIELFTIGPARVIWNNPKNVVAGLCAGQGTLVAGASADITIFDLSARFTIDSSRFKSKSRNTPFEGRHVSGKIVHIIINGRFPFSEDY